MNILQPIVLLSQDVSHSGPVYRDECDCACPDNGFEFPKLAPAIHVPLSHPGLLHTQSLPFSHRLMFNPLHNDGVAVLNPAALHLWERFAAPLALEAAGLLEAEWAAVSQMLKAGLLAPTGFQPQPRQGVPRTLSAWLHVTNDCNLRCDYCYLNKSAESMRPEIGRAAVDAALRSATRNGFRRVKLKFAGGEAALNLKLVLELSDYARQQAAEVGLGLDAVVLSNGVALGERAIAALEASGLRVMISLDGIGEAHDRQRLFANGQGSFAWVDRTLNRLLARGIRPFISITVSDRNADGLPDVVRYVLERRLPFNINFFRENECAAPFTDLRLQESRLIAALQRAFAVIAADLPEHSLLGSLVDRSQFDQLHDKTCGVGDSYLVIDQRGGVAKCQMEIETTVTDIYVDDPLAFVRADRTGLQNVSVEEKEGCRDCEWKYWCTGGCPAVTFRATGRFDVKSPNCRIYKAIYPEVLRLEGLRLMKLGGLPVAA